MIRGLLTGVFFGSLVSAIGLALVSLSVPLPGQQSAMPSDQSAVSSDQSAMPSDQSDVTEPENETMPEAAIDEPGQDMPLVDEPFNQIEPEPQAVLTPDTPAPNLPNLPEPPTATSPMLPEFDNTETAPRPDPTADIERPRIAFPSIGDSATPSATTTDDDPLAPPAELQPNPMDTPSTGQSPDVDASSEPAQALAPSVAQPVPPPPSLGGTSIVGSGDNTAQANEQGAAPLAPAVAGVAPPPPALSQTVSPPSAAQDDTAPANPLLATLQGAQIEPPTAQEPQPQAPVLPDATAAPSSNSLIAPPPSAAPAPQGTMVAPNVTSSRAIERFAAAFNPAEARPLMSVILIDDPEAELDRATLTALDIPVTIAIDPLRDDAAEVSALYRAAGFEIVLMATMIPEGAEASDVEVALSSAQESLPETVAVLDSVDGRIQSDRAVLDAVVGALADTGHGLVAFPQGLNAAEASATREGVPAATLFRQLDDERERATVISRFLDRAAFAAAQDGAVIVLGHTYSETVTALYSWALGTRSESVALAPLSAVLLREPNAEQQ